MRAEEDERDEQIRKLTSELNDEKRRRRRDKLGEKEDRKKGRKKSVESCGDDKKIRMEKLRLCAEKLSKLRKSKEEEEIVDIFDELKKMRLTGTELSDIMPVIRTYRYHSGKIGRQSRSLLERYFNKVISRDASAIFKCRINIFDRLTLDFSFPVVVTVKHLLKRVAKEVGVYSIKGWDVLDVDKLPLSKTGTVLACGCTKTGKNRLDITSRTNPGLYRIDSDDSDESDTTSELEDNVGRVVEPSRDETSTEEDASKGSSDTDSTEDSTDNTTTSDSTDKTSKSCVTDTDADEISTSEEDDEDQIEAVDVSKDKDEEDEIEFIREAYRILRLEHVTTETVKATLERLAEEKVSIQGIETLLPMILGYGGEGKDHEQLVKRILRQHGNALRRLPDHDQVLNLTVHIAGHDYPIRFDYHPHAKVKQLRKDIQATLGLPQSAVTLMVHGYQMKEHEYLIECGCYPNRTVDIQARILKKKDIVLNTPPDARTPEYHCEEQPTIETNPVSTNQDEDFITQIWQNAQHSDPTMEGTQETQKEDITDKNPDAEAHRILQEIRHDDEETEWPVDLDNQGEPLNTSDTQTQTSPPLKRKRGRPKKTDTIHQDRTTKVRRQSTERTSNLVGDAENQMRTVALKLREFSRKREEEVNRHSDETYKILTLILKMRAHKGQVPTHMRNIITQIAPGNRRMFTIHSIKYTEKTIQDDQRSN